MTWFCNFFFPTNSGGQLFLDFGRIVQTLLPEYACRQPSIWNWLWMNSTNTSIRLFSTNSGGQLFLDFGWIVQTLLPEYACRQPLFETDFGWIVQTLVSQAVHSQYAGEAHFCCAQCMKPTSTVSKSRLPDKHTWERFPRICIRNAWSQRRFSFKKSAAWISLINTWALPKNLIRNAWSQRQFSFKKSVADQHTWDAPHELLYAMHEANINRI